jgi:chromate reductase, NAD(P)H dehydrogenase (quinone)
MGTRQVFGIDEGSYMVRVLAVCGSLQARSTNLSLLESAAASSPDGAEIVLFDGLRHLPLFNPDLEASGAPPSVLTWRRALIESDAVLIASPEYGFSLPGALKNAIDWTIGSGELNRKVVGVTAAVSHPGRGRGGLEALMNTLRAVDARIVGGQPIVRGSSFEGEIAALVRALMDEVRRQDEP